MVDRKVYKTKICMMYQRGRCSRQNCSFAHGQADLRRSLDGRQDWGSRDLRERLDRMRSPSGRKDVNARHQTCGDSPPSSRKRIKHSENNQLDSHSDYSGTWRMSNGITEDQMRDRRKTPSDSRMYLDEQLREMQSEIRMLDNDKRELEIYLEDMVHEADGLTLKIQELEMQLSKEKEECRRITSKIKKFTTAHSRHVHLQDELKRSQAKVQKLGELLDVDAAGCNEDGSKNIITSNDDNGTGAVSPTYEIQLNSSGKKRSRVLLEDHNSSAQVNPIDGESNEKGKTRLDTFSWNSGSRNQLDNHDPSMVHAFGGVNSSSEKKSKGKLKPRYDTVANKIKVSEKGFVPPSTGIAAHELDKEAELVEADEKASRSPSDRAKEEAAMKPHSLPFLPPPPPPIPENAYSQYKGDDEHVDIDGVNEEMIEVDIV